MYIVNKTVCKTVLFVESLSLMERVSLVIQVSTLVILCFIVGSWFTRPIPAAEILTTHQLDMEDKRGNFSVTVNRVFAHSRADMFRIDAGGYTQNMKKGETRDRSFVFIGVQYWEAVYFTVFQGPHQRAQLMLLPAQFKRGTHIYRIDNTNAVLMSLDWVKDVVYDRL